MVMPITLDNSPATDWQSELARAVRDPAELCRLLDLPADWVEASRRASGDFSLCVPRPYLGRIQPCDPRDPLLLQVLPQVAETTETPGFERDPLGESSSMPEMGLLWKYHGRILIVAAGSCSIHCRFCFRRYFPYSSGVFSEILWENLLHRLKNEPSVHEVILSGGDPLILQDTEIENIVHYLADVPHLKRVRIHSRLPITIPNRITDELLNTLRASKLSPLVVIHINHPAEIDDAVAAALARLVDAGIPLLSQSVLLRGVNDRLEILAALFERLADLRVMPYYLHQLDSVAGAAHFQVPISEGTALIHQLRNLLPGYAVPRYVRETRNGGCKENLA